VEMLVQKVHKTLIPSFHLDQTGHILDDVERVGPFVTFGPAFLIPCPSAVGVSRFHKPGVLVENGARGGERAVEEE
jgi:hypothetical protein